MQYNTVKKYLREASIANFAIQYNQRAQSVIQLNYPTKNYRKRMKMYGLLGNTVQRTNN